MYNCTYCTRPAHTQIVANNQIYCGKLCAAMGLVREVDQEEQIMDDFGSTDTLIERVLHEGPLPLPIKVRFSDLEDMDNVHRILKSAPEGFEAVIVQIDDSGTPDWVPDLSEPAIA